MHSHHRDPFSRGGGHRCFEAHDERGRHGEGHGPRGRGGPFGRHRGGPFGGRGARLFDAGALRLVVLGLLAEVPRHGYDVIKALEARFQGAYSPSPGSIYPMLQMMEDADLAASTTVGTKRLYAVTDQGRAYLEENRAELDKINAQLAEASGALGQAALGEAVHDLRKTLFAKLRGGSLSAEQAAKARTILEQAIKDLEAL
jgi:DNA-binding PadR family transcriptional regulator